MTLKAEPFEEELSCRLTAALEPQRGKALAAFRTAMAEEDAAERDAMKFAAPARGAKQVSRKEVFFWSSVPSLIAACVAVAVTLRFIAPAADTGSAPRDTAHDTMIAGNSSPVEVTPTMNQTEVVQREDGGVLVNNNVPVRVVREHTTKTTQWNEPDGSTYQLTEPGEKVQYIQVHPD